MTRPQPERPAPDNGKLPSTTDAAGLNSMQGKGERGTDTLLRPSQRVLKVGAALQRANDRLNIFRS